MTIQPSFGSRIDVTLSYTGALLLAALLLTMDRASAADPPARNDYPTAARVEYVNDCIGHNGGTLAALYQCSCVIDAIAAKLSYEEFVEAGTYAKYATLPGEVGGIFRDSDEAKGRAKLYRELESAARESCGLAH